jgi:hypothetical protein
VDDVRLVLHVEFLGKIERKKREGRLKQTWRMGEGGRLTTPANEGHISKNTIKSKDGTHSLLQ